MSASNANRPDVRGVSALPGCYIFAMGAGLLVAAGIWAAYTFMRQADELKAFTDPAPAPLVVEPPDPARAEDLQRRLTAFAETVTAGQVAAISLTADDLNTLLAGFPRLADVKPLLHVRRLGPGATFTADIRFPMNALPGRRRFLNGELDGRFGVHPEAGLFISVLDVRVPGRTVPPGFLDVYQRGIIPGKNFGFLDDMLIRNFRDDPAFAVPLKRITSLPPAEDRLILSTAKGQTTPTPADALPVLPAPAEPAQNATQPEEKS